MVSKWGNNLGIRLPKDLATRAGLSDGARVDVTLEGGRIIIALDRPIYALDELLSGLTPDAMHDVFDWGPDRGREDVP
ncbi:MAG: AbrB/MazE/SpoVT family DNA-binding domain-containing protein [Rhodospirillaceae bacterium]|nr:AbrB/MazE/SpoVT family DNA-binding domain-containing protein [Rhodospirillaceae bacterium]